MNYIFGFIGITLSIFSIFYAYQANQISLEASKQANMANIIAMEANAINKNQGEYDKTRNSYSIVDETFNEIYNDAELRKVIKDISDDNISDTEKAGKIVDILENLGSKYCKGLVNKEHIRASLVSTLKSVCNSDQINTLYGGRKNATALLCYTLLPSSSFSSNFKKETLSTCSISEN